MRREEEESILQSFRKIENYQPIFSKYGEYEHKIMPGTITAIGECTQESNKLPSKTLLMIGIPENVYSSLWEGFLRSGDIHLLEPLAGEGFDLWVIAVPQPALKRVVWIVFPVTVEDMNEMRGHMLFSLALVPISQQSFDELAERVDTLIKEVNAGKNIPCGDGLIIILNLSDIL